MFTPNHLIWLALCAVLISVIGIWLLRHKPPLRQVLTAACVVCVASELIKVFSSITLVPSADGSVMIPYLEMQHLPLHLCSMQIIFIFYARFSADSARRTALLAFMYPTCIGGALLALAMPSIFTNSVSPERAFVHPLAYQYFLYHSMLILLGLYIAASGQVALRPKHAATTVLLLAVMAFLSLYVNSMFAAPVYVNTELISVEYTPNLLFTYEPPLPIPITQLWHWYVYLAAIVLIALLLITLLYLPIFIKARRKAVSRQTDGLAAK